MLAIVSFILVIVIVVSVHEYGHYVAARWYGVRVLRFSVGFGKPLFMRHDRHATEWVLAPILLGGYVRLLDKREAEEHGFPVKEAVEGQSYWRRIVIYAAGPLANILLSFVILFFLLIGGEQGLPAQVDSVRPHSPAAAAGIAAGDTIASVNGDDVILWRQAEAILTDAMIAGEDIAIESRDGRNYVIAADDSLSLSTLEQYGGAAAALGMFAYEGYIKLKIATVLKDSPAAAAGLVSGDEMVAMDGVLLEHWREAVDIIKRHPKQPMSLVIWRDGSPLTLTVTPAAVVRARRESGYLGVAPAIDRSDLSARLITLSYSPLGLVAAAVEQTGADVSRALSFLRLMLQADVSREHISGPVGIAVQSGEAADLGFSVWLRFVTLISTSLGILNLLPLPMLDGGQIVLNMLQWISRREFADSTLKWWYVSGAVILLMLMGFVIINDIVQLL